MNNNPKKWHEGVTRYQWLVLIIAAAGWAFDAFEGQLFNITRVRMLTDLLHVERDSALVKLWGKSFSEYFSSAEPSGDGCLAHWPTNGVASR